jgi:hypothetical protein
MKRKFSQRELILVALAVVLFAILLYYFSTKQGGVGTGDYESRFPNVDPSQIGSLLRIPVLDLARLEEPIGQFANNRNLFAYGSGRRPGDGEGGETGKTAEVKPPDKTPAEEELTETEEAAAAETEVARLPDPPDIELKFVGFIGPPRDKIVFLLDEETEQRYIGAEGDVIAGQFRIVQVGYEYVNMGYTDPLFEDRTQRIILAEWSEESDEDDRQDKK